ncbi:P-loop NTPase fold protein [Actinokineospora pegani]|uniref:P-loop NTPase fold protein n=1 Tax=Actinokineospora pegani TaxID=2654637 RepID=UPI0018D3DBE2|nr:P-loop NTPase fold protein [Actinokineospora pegani]
MISPALVAIGDFNGTEVLFAITAKPWDLDVDALVVPVGDTLGTLARALLRHLPELDGPLHGLPFDQITPTSTTGVELPRHLDARVRHVILTSPHGEDREASLSSVWTATASALEAAATRCDTVALPLIGGGSLGMSKHEIAVHLGARLRALDTSELRRVIVFDDSADVSTELRAGAPPAELSGGALTDLVDVTQPIPAERDKLGVSPFARMLAGVIVDRETTTPLSIGVFGQWGSGKSFFLGLLRKHIEDLAASGAPRLCGQVRHISFNAWHYADTDLWASIADVVFRGLAVEEPGPARQRERLRELIERHGDDVSTLEQERAEAGKELDRLRSEVRRARASTRTGVRDLVRAVRDSERAKAEVPDLADKLGVPEDATIIVRELSGLAGETAKLRELPRTRHGAMALAAAALVLVVSVALTAAWSWTAAVGGPVALVLGAVGAAWMERAHRGAVRLRELGEEIRGSLDAQADVLVGEALHRLREAEDREAAAVAGADAAVTRLAGLRAELEGLAPSRRWGEFVGTRARGDLYTRRLGTVTQLREDFEDLVSLLRDWRDDAGPDDKPVERIVLYIDDLDRCDAHQVVEVLEAVHLLLAMDLFVVVLGVDPGWLQRSVDARHRDSVRDGSAERYLEKVITIPFALPAMPRAQVGEMLRSLVDIAPTAAHPVPATTAEATTVERGSPLDTAVHRPADPAPHHGLTTRELRALDRVSGLVDTPRAAKRLVNIYRMIRATRELSTASEFLDRDHELVIILIGLVVAAPNPAAVFHDLTQEPLRTWNALLADNSIIPESTPTPEKIATWAQAIGRFRYSTG